MQQRKGVELGQGVAETGDRYEQHADAVATRVIAGRSAEDLLSQVPAAGLGAAPGPAVQREEVKKAKSGVGDVALGLTVTTTIDVGLAKVDETLLTGARQVRLAIRNDAEFARAWDDYADRSGTPGARMEEGLNGFVDPTHPDGKTGFVRASAGMGTAIHEAMHQRAAATFNATTVGRAVNEGTTELFTRVVIAYGGGKIPRAVYDKENLAMLRFQAITGLTALAQWLFKGDSSAVEKALAHGSAGSWTSCARTTPTAPSKCSSLQLVEERRPALRRARGRRSGMGVARSHRTVHGRRHPRAGDRVEHCALQPSVRGLTVHRLCDPALWTPSDTAPVAPPVAMSL
ncbi:MAG TPA: hypothetical protein VJ829_06275 [Candidatus Binatia bacterium]|nr:hypothetical protein [Candidatus Binatia bacterium]